MTKNIMIDLLENNKKYFEDFISRNTYHSNAIEGSTLSFAETYAILFNDNSLKINAIPREIYEAINHKYAINMILDAIKEKNHNLSHEFIIQINQIINKNIQYIGGYRLYPIRIIGREESLPLPNQLQHLMDKFINKYNDYFSKNFDFETLAAYHIEFEHIHPFPDGNGRTGRLLIMYQLIKHDLYPIVIPVNKRAEYINMIKNKDITGLGNLLRELNENERLRIADFIVMKKEEEKAIKQARNQIKTDE